MRFRHLITLALLFVATDAAAGKPVYRIAEVRALSPEMQREFAALKYLMTDQEQREFLEAPDHKTRQDLVRRFWVRNDPEPTTPGNSMRVEHYERVEWARADYGENTWPGWDVRGEMLIRYGPPDYTGHIQGEVSPSGYSPPSELWYYKLHNMVIAFEDFEGKGHYKLAISSSGPYRYLTPEIVEFLLLDENPAYNGIIPANLLDSNYVKPDRRRSTVERQSLMERGRDMAGNTQQIFEEHLSTYDFNFEKEKRFPFFFDTNRFSAGEEATRLDVDCEFIVERDAENPGERTITASAVIFDHAYNEVDNMVSDIRVDPSDATWARLVPIQLTGTVPPGKYHIAVSLYEENTERTSAFWTDVDCTGFADTLAVSDILFAQRISDSAETGSPFARGSVVVVPHPVRRYIKGGSLPVYFEIYNLVRDDVGRAEYEIEYRIVPRSGKRTSFLDRFHGSPTVVSSRFTSSSQGTSDAVHFTVHTENLEPGLYDFLVSIKDTWTQTLAWREASFRIQQGAITLDEFKE